MPKINLTDAAIKRLTTPESGQIDYWDTQLKGFGLRISSGGTKTFIINKNKTRQTVGRYPAMSLAEARREALRLKLIDENPSLVTFTEARDAFISKHLASLKPTTAHEQTNLIKRFKYAKQLSAISQEDVMRVLRDMPPGSARSCFNIIRTFFNWCVAQGYLQRTPLRAKSPYKPTSRDRLLTDQEVQQIWTESRNHENFGVIVRLALLTGQRIAQIAEFKPHWVQGDLIVFPASIMKSNQEHALPLTDAMRVEIANHQPLISLSRPMDKFRDALEVEHFTLHDFRRYFSSTMAKLKVPIDVTEAILDHRSGSRSQIQRIYDRHDRLPEIREALTLYHQHLSQFCEGLNVSEPR